MVAQALDQMLSQTNWKDIDYLIVDMPPGTGDIQLSLAQKVPVTGAIIVTTPQDIALIDARKGLKMFEKVNIPILGIVENMSIHICSKCGHEEHIFGTGGGEQMCKDYDVEFLGSLPLEMAIREMADGGKPTVVGAPDSRTAEIYRGIARRVAIKVAEKAKDMPSNETKFIWYGHSALLMRMNHQTILIDPMLGPNAAPISPFSVNRFSDNTLELAEDFPEINLLLLTHDHYDHLDYESIQRLKLKVKKYFVALGVARRAKRGTCTS